MAIMAISAITMSCNKDDKDDKKTALFDLIHEGKVLPDDATVTLVQNADTATFELISCNISVINNTAAKLNIKVKKEVLSKAPSDVADVNFFCWGGQCLASSTLEAIKDVMPKTTSPQGELFTGDVNTPTLPDGRTEIRIKYEFSDTASDFDRTITVNYIYNK